MAGLYMENDSPEVVIVGPENADEFDAPEDVDVIVVDVDDVEVVVLGVGDLDGQPLRHGGSDDTNAGGTRPEPPRHREITAYPVVERLANVRSELPERHCVGTLTAVCRHCCARHFRAESTVAGHYATCCNNGLVTASDERALRPAPDVLMGLLVDDCNVAKHFRKTVRRYNSALAFASFRNVNRRVVPGRGPKVFTVHGQMYHYVSNDLMRDDGQPPRYCELYFLESATANRTRAEQRTDRDQPFDETLLRELDAMIRRINPYAQAFRNMREVWQRELQRSRDNPACRPMAVTMRFVTDGSTDPRRYNAPTANEVAAVFVGDDGRPPQSVELVIHVGRLEGSRMQIIPSGVCHADPMLYPLLFPHGERGWDTQLLQQGPRRTVVRNRITIREFACHRIAVRYDGNNDTRHPRFSLIHAGGFLFQAFVCDQYVRMEANNLMYIRTHQRELFAEAYQGILDHINRHHDVHAGRDVGRRMILPATFTGSPRYMKQCYHDAMAVVRKYGKPDLFVTFTCNPRWPEIRDNLGRNVTASDRPDLTARVFHLKLKALMTDITVNRVFGDVQAYVYTVEFQKRGLPHAHILLILSDAYKFRTAEDIDRVVRADIPDPRTEQRLHDIVVSHMIHGPCGPINPNSPCMCDGVCSKSYPKALAEETVFNSECGYPTYRRPDNGTTVFVRGHVVGNEFVVPYNPYVLAKYDAHINAEVCSTVKSVMYLYKYVYKGHDAATVVIDEDEVSSFVNARYVSPPEAFWRLAAYEMHARSHTVVRLPVHTEGHHYVYYERGDAANRLRHAEHAGTKLTAFFALNVSDENARHYLYHDIPAHYTWNNPSRTWRARRRSSTYPVLARMSVVNPLDKDRFNLRLLLLHRRGPLSFVDLRTVNGRVYDTYAGAAIASGLLEDDHAWRSCLAESSALDTPVQQRYLFVTILAHCAPADPVALYEANEVNFMGDPYRARASSLDAVDKLLRMQGHSLEKFGLPLPDRTLLVPEPHDDHAHVDHAVRADELLRRLNADQQALYDRVMSVVDDDDGNVTKLFYVGGPGGTGKTTLYGCLISTLRGQGRSVLSVAFTGIAAGLLDGGVTVHNAFGLPVDTLTEDSASNVSLQSAKARRIRYAELIVWDEAPMCPGVHLTVVDRLLRDVMDKNVPFGGKATLFTRRDVEKSEVCGRLSRSNRPNRKRRLLITSAIGRQKTRYVSISHTYTSVPFATCFG